MTSGALDFGPASPNLFAPPGVKRGLLIWSSESKSNNVFMLTVRNAVWPFLITKP